MASKANVQSTVEVMLDMSRTLRETADRIERHAEKMQETGDLEYASDAISAVTGMIPNLRLDLMAARPIRHLQIAAAENRDNA